MRRLTTSMVYLLSIAGLLSGVMALVWATDGAVLHSVGAMGVAVVLMLLGMWLD